MLPRAFPQANLGKMAITNQGSTLDVRPLQYVFLTSEKTEKGKFFSLLKYIVSDSKDSIHMSTVNKMLCWHPWEGRGGGGCVYTP